MDDTGNPSQPIITPVTQIQSPTPPGYELDVLRNVLVMALAGLVLVSGSFMLYMYHQMRVVRKKFSKQRPAMTRALQDFQDVNVPKIEKFSVRIQAYAATHPDFKPIMQ